MDSDGSGKEAVPYSKQHCRFANDLSVHAAFGLPPDIQARLQAVFDVRWSHRPDRAGIATFFTHSESRDRWLRSTLFTDRQRGHVGWLDAPAIFSDS